MECFCRPSGGRDQGRQAKTQPPWPISLIFCCGLGEAWPGGASHPRRPGGHNGEHPARQRPRGGEAAMTYIAVTALSHPGAVRDNNEDSLVAGPWTLCATVTENPQTLFFPLGTPLVAAVADGLGGHPGGEVANALVARPLAQIRPYLASEQSRLEALRTGDRAVHAPDARDLAPAATGTTVAGVVV